MTVDHQQEKSHIPLTIAPSSEPCLREELQMVPPAETEGEVQLRIRMNKSIADKINEAQAKHKMRLELTDQRHKHNMEVLKHVVPIVSGVTFLIIGVFLIGNPEELIKYFGFSLICIGACALIPGIPGVFTNIAATVKALYGFAAKAQELAIEAAKAEEEEKQ